LIATATARNHRRRAGWLALDFFSPVDSLLLLLGSDMFAVVLVWNLDDLISAPGDGLLGLRRRRSRLFKPRWRRGGSAQLGERA
jgi:hypothetical protein